MAIQEAVGYTLFLNDEERSALLGLLETELSDVHVERRRTEAMRLHDQIAHEEQVLRGLTDKVRALRQ